jgi:glutamate-5-semialdehyde dehydrogenase
MEATAMIAELADKARLAARTLIAASDGDRVEALNRIADELRASEVEILAANSADMDNAVKDGMTESMQDRLLLTAARVAGMADGARQVSRIPSPLGKTLRESTLENGLHLKQNAALLRGSSSAAKSNQVLVTVMRRALAKTNISPDVIQLVPSDDRSTVAALLHARGKVDLVIPRGSAALIRTVVDDSTVPTIETGAGVCHVYVDAEADLTKALPIVMNSKTHRPSVCNAAETLLVHESVAVKFLPTALAALREARVKLNVDSATAKIAQANNLDVSIANEANWSTEYNALEMNVAIVQNLLAASDHIAKYGTKHTEAIVTESEANAAKFIALSDCAAVMVNASTRFTDGEQMGFGAEIGISNQKLHARGPMGLEQMTTTTWIVTGSGQIRA